MKAILSFDHFDVVETVFKYNPFESLESEEVSPSFQLKIKHKDKERTEAALIFYTELGDQELKENSFYIKTAVIGVFSLETQDDVEEGFKDTMYKKNALAILYPYVRSLISDLSSKGSLDPIRLPPINIAAMVENNNLITEQYNEDDHL